MTPTDSFTVTVDLPTLGVAGVSTVVWLGGEHDLATVAEIRHGVAAALLRSDAEVVLDLSGITFMDASTIGAIARARADVLLASRSMSVRAPSRPAGRVLELCAMRKIVA